MSREYAVALGARLRAVRRQHGMTLQQVHQRSGRRWSTVVLGSYERADRAVSVTTLAELAAFYGVRTEDLLPTEPAPAEPQQADRKLTIDLQRIPTLPSRLAGPLARYASAIQHQRDSHTGAALTIRDQDLQSLAVIYDMDPHTLTETLTHWGVLAQDAPRQRQPTAEDPHHRPPPDATR
jgi:transcriptional regulator with XRE-family HTH domain